MVVIDTRYAQCRPATQTASAFALASLLRLVEISLVVLLVIANLV